MRSADPARGSGALSLVLGVATASFALQTLLSAQDPAGIDPVVVGSYDGANPREACGPIAGIGDVDGDGFADWVVGCSGTAPGGLVDAGTVYARSGRTGAVLWTFDGEAAGDSLGKVVTASQDIDQDGVFEVVLGVQNAAPGGMADAGRVYVLDGSDGSLLLSVDGENAGDLFGRTAHLMGDVDGDNFPNLLISAPEASPGGISRAGYVAVFNLLGGEIWRMEGPEIDYRLGRSTSPIGDVDGDDKDDVLIGSRFANPSGLQGAGSVRVVSGDDGSLIYELEGQIEQLGFGRSVAAVPDLDGDTVPEVLAGAPGKNNVKRPGEAYLFSGASGTELASFIGDQEKDFFGWKVVGLDDLNGDGLAEFLVAAPQDDSHGAWDAGRITVFSGASPYPVLYTYRGLEAQDQLGWNSALLGDVDGDAVPDVGVGSPYTSPDGKMFAGRAQVISQRPYVLDPAQVGGGWQEIFRFEGEAGDTVGSTVAPLEDVDGDGYTDLIVGFGAADPGGRIDAGAARVYSGADGSELFYFEGIGAGDEFGKQVADAGDVDMDGVHDILVAARLADPSGRIDAGQVFVYSGADGSLIWQLDGELAGDYFGRSVSTAGDINQDGHDDVFVGASRASPNGVNEAGVAYVFSGQDASILRRFEGTYAGGRLGRRVAGLDDLNADTVPELLVGAPQEEPNGWLNAGSAYLYSGLTGGLLQRFDAEEERANFGYSLAPAGDTDGDGVSDFIIGAYKAGPGGKNEAGSAYVYSGANYSLLLRADGSNDDDWMSYAIGCAGDVDGDGLDDVAVSAPRAGAEFGQGTVYVFSVARQELIYRLAGSASQLERFGWSMSPVVRGNGDTDLHLLVGAPLAAPAGFADAGRAYLKAFRPFLRATDDEISSSQGGLLDYQIEFPPSEAGMRYAFLISARGIGPTAVHGLSVPLTPDSLFNASLQGTLPFAFEGNGVGNLDEDARAMLSLNLPAGSFANKVGRTLYAAAVSFSTETGVRVASAPLGVTLVQ